MVIGHHGKRGPNAANHVALEVNYVVGNVPTRSPHSGDRRAPAHPCKSKRVELSDVQVSLFIDWLIGNQAVLKRIE